MSVFMRPTFYSYFIKRVVRHFVTALLDKAAEHVLNLKKLQRRLLDAPMGKVRRFTEYLPALLSPMIGIVDIFVLS